MGCIYATVAPLSLFRALQIAIGSAQRDGHNDSQPRDLQVVPLKRIAALGGGYGHEDEPGDTGQPKHGGHVGGHCHIEHNSAKGMIQHNPEAIALVKSRPAENDRQSNPAHGTFETVPPVGGSRIHDAEQ